MEVTVLDAQNTPKKPVIAIRVGSALRHAELALNTPFHVPARDMQDSRVKVSLYEQLGTQTIPDADEPESVCNVPVRAPDGTCTQVKLRIRRGQNSSSLANQKRNQVGVEDYLNTHQLEARLQSLFETVLKKQPLDPYRCMIEELRKAKCPGEDPAASIEASQATAPKAPVAPAEPKPKDARPSPAAKGRNVKPSDDAKNAKEEADTKAALQQLMSSHSNIVESQSLSGAREQVRKDAVAAMKAKSDNSGLANSVMRHILRKNVGMADPAYWMSAGVGTLPGRLPGGADVLKGAPSGESRSLGMGSRGDWDTGGSAATSTSTKVDRQLSTQVLRATFQKVSSQPF